MGSSALLETEFRYLAGPGSWVACSLRDAVAAEVARGFPVREFPTYRGQRNYPGWLWLSTTRSLVGYESLLERDRLWLADFDPEVAWVAGQPFWVSGRDGQKGDESWEVMTDPEGNLFCILQGARDHDALVRTDPGSMSRVEGPTATS